MSPPSMCCNRTCDTNETSSFILKNIRLDVSIDGADDVDPNLCLIKGNVIFAYLGIVMNHDSPPFSSIRYSYSFFANITSSIYLIILLIDYISYHSILFALWHVIGGGGALLREKMVEVVSDKFICIVDESKLSKVS